MILLGAHPSGSTKLTLKEGKEGHSVLSPPQHGCKHALRIAPYGAAPTHPKNANASLRGAPALPALVPDIHSYGFNVRPPGGREGPVFYVNSLFRCEVPSLGGFTLNLT